MRLISRSSREPDQLFPVKVLIAAALFLALIIVVMEDGTGTVTPPVQETTPPPETTTSVIDENFIMINMTYSDMSEGDLVLVNEDHAIDEIRSDLVDVVDNAAVEGVRVRRSLAKSLNEWLTDSNLQVTAGFRTLEEEQALYDAAEPGTLASPGHSEHQTGLCVDLDADNEADQTALVHAWEYGFVRRYPSYKSSLTGIRTNVSHFRYVGLPHSGIMKDYDLCLEEYITTLRAYPFDGNHLKVVYLGKSYEIYYCKGLEVAIPINRDYTISGNNKDGFIVTIEDKA